jgi:putative oxidoreductase
MSVPLNSGDDALDRVGLHAHWLLRIAMASVFIYMGIDKFVGGGIQMFAQMMDLPWLIALLVALAELGAGIFIIAGAFTNDWISRLGAAMAIPVLLGAIVMEHWGQWHFMATPTHPLGGMMFQVTLLLVALYILIRGNRF